tara:strand:- start:2063 stop:2398 length:336 start_codon:yes stop_codon:yes gene_type:complete
MHITIDYASQFRSEFHRADRQTQFSYEGLGLLFEYLEEIDPDYDLDVVALCCDYSEECAEDIARNYSIDLNDADPEGNRYDTECRAIVRAYLEDHTSIVGETATGFIYAQF